jgi:Tfp pilus assembly protein PilF
MALPALPLLAALAAAQPRPGGPAVVDVKPPQAAVASNIDAVWSEYQRLDAANDLEGAAKALSEIARMRAERNIYSLEPIALALVGKGSEKLRTGEQERAEQYFRGALGIDPYLPDAHLGLAQAHLRRGPLGLLPAAQRTMSAVAQPLSTWRGRYRLQALLMPALLVAFLATATVVAVSLLIHYGGLLLHDLEEEFGPTRGEAFARGLFVFALLLPIALQQGYAWLPLWWMALVFVYLTKVERVVVALLLLGGIAIGPLVKTLDTATLTQRNPLFRPSMQAVRGEADPRAIALLERARRDNADDKDLAYLLARQYRKAGRDDDAANLYRELLAADQKDPIALNNLANLDFARGDFDAAKARYKQGSEMGANSEFTATFFYNLSLAHLQKFEFQPQTEMRGQADRLAGGLTKDYESLWKYDKAGTAVATVAELGLSDEQVAQKYWGAAQGIVRKNVAGSRSGGAVPDLAGSLLTRFLGFVFVFAAVVFALMRWRGEKLFTLRCPKCGTAFCKRCHLGQVAGSLCTQCYHLFVVKDGVSVAAKNQKLLAVQKQDEKRIRIFRILSLLSPGAGHVYGRKIVPGLVLVILWYTLLAITLLAGRPMPVTEAPSTLVGPWVLAPSGVALLIIFIVANRWRPSFEVELPVIKRTPVRRAQPAAQQG